MPDLNEAQRTAVLHDDGPLLVFAGAGSGKTRVITHRIARLVADVGVPPYRILAVTFTNKAAGEMRQRLANLAGEAANDLWVGTFHSISARLLRRYGSELGLSQRFSIYDDSDQKALIARVMKQQGYDERQLAPKLCLSRIHAKKHEGIGPESITPSPEFDDVLVNIYTGYEKALRAADAVDFDDLILCMVRLLESRPSQGSLSGRGGEELRNRYDYVLVDEFQDTNAIQYRWVRAFAERTRNLCVVGDDDQSIYAWRGADIRNIREFVRDFPDAKVVKLEQNYRSTANIVLAAQRVIEVALDRQDKALWTDAKGGDKIILTALRDEREEAELVANTLLERIRAGISPRELAVFYRINAQSRVLEEALRRAKLPYQIVGGMRFFERAEVKNLLAYLRVLSNPKSDADLVRIINLPTRGLGNKTVDRLLYNASARGTSVLDAIPLSLDDGEFTGATKKKLESFVALMDELGRDMAELVPSELAQKVLEKTGYQQALRTENSAEADARLENLAELVGSIKEYEGEAERDGRRPTLDEYLERVALVSDVDAVEDGSTVLLMTVHSAKGLEFDTVFLTGMEEETFPYRGLDSETNDELEEERRLAYVAITRARRRLYISHTACRTIFGQTRYLEPSRFLEQLPDEVLERRGLPAWALRVHGAAARGRRAEFEDPVPEEAWDQRAPAVRAPEPWGSAPTGPLPRSLEPRSPSIRNPSIRGPLTRSPAATSPVRPAPRQAVAAAGDAERTVDYSAFDDVPSDAITSDEPEPYAASEAPRGAPLSLRRGMRVYHRRFGNGVVEACEGPDKVVARFKGFGPKKVMLEYLTLQK
jgi:DNA helicase-2/ATP-dependent DNA helicase PcrA